VKAPQGWDATKLGNIAEITMGQSPAGNTYNVTGVGKPLINGPAEFGSLYPTPVQWTTKPTKICRVADILFCVRGNTAGRLNRADQEYCIGRGISAIRGCLQRATTEFLYYFLEHQRPIIYRIGASAGSTFPNVGFHDLSSYNVALPPLSEQQGIASILSTVDDSIQKCDEIITKTQQLKTGLMHQLFTLGIGHAMFKQTDLGEIPEEWEVVRLRELVAEVKPGFPSGERDPDGIVQLRMNNISIDGRIVLDSLLKVPTPKDVESYLLRQGDILFNNTNSVELIGKSAFFDGKLDYVTYSNHLTRIRVDKARVFPNWLLHVLIRKWQLNYFRSVCLRHVGQAGIRSADLLSIKVALPALSEQKEIASILSTLDEKKEKETQKKEALQYLKKGLMDDLVTGKVRVKVT
jgi:type I restriction enzyme, S subunit